MRDVYLWTGYALVAVVAAVVIVAVLESVLERPEQRPQPAAFEPIPLPPATDELTRVLPVRFVGRAQVRRRLTLPSLALLVDFIAQEAAVQRALAYELTSAPVWTEVEALFELRRLAVAA
jgi:hypothetical protein